MTRDRVDDTEPTPPAVEPTQPGSPSLDETDPGPPPEPTREGDDATLTTEADMLRAEQLIEAFKRPPRRPTPAYTERAQSEGGNAVGYATIARAAQTVRPVQERERVLVQLAEAARGRPGPAPGPHESLRGKAEVGRSDLAGLLGALRTTDVPTGPSEEKRRRRRLAVLGLGALASVGALGALILAVEHARSQDSVLEIPTSAASTTPRPPAVPPAATRVTPEEPATGGPSSPSPGVVEATSTAARPIGSAGLGTKPPRERRLTPEVEPPVGSRLESPPAARLAPSASSSTTTPLKDQFWE